ncbi:23S rRNA (pseudouridine(1915)-N(3))-methyltransferase RlmH [bacterium]|nr:23S rRNA (pseudouridine(1915)-N(3))-methyltransferase RlmH [bacterium]
MKYSLILINKSKDNYIAKGFVEYESRLKHYARFETIVLELPKKQKFASVDMQKNEEGKLLLQSIGNQDFLVLLDDKGKSFSSEQFANQIQKWQVSGVSNVIFVIGGPFGFSLDVYARANLQLSLSRMTLTHQMVRLFFLEQLYRAHTIIKGEKYHH